MHPVATGSTEQGEPPSAAALVHKKSILASQLFHQHNEIFSCLKDKYSGVGRNLTVFYFAPLLLQRVRRICITVSRQQLG